MRIAIISDHRGWAWAGCEELWAALAHSALESGHEVATFLCRRNISETKIKPLLDRGMKLNLPGRGVTVAERLRRYSWKAGKFASRFTGSFSEIGRFQPDAVLFNSGDPIPHPIVLHQLERAGALRWPYAIMCQNSYLYEAPPEGAYRDAAIRFFQGACYVLTAAQRTVNDIEHLLAARTAPARLIRNPVNIRDTHYIAMPATDEVRIANLGRLAIVSKGQDILLAALADSGLNRIPWRLAFYGEGSDAGHLNRLAKHYGIADRVAIKGYATDIRAIWAENHLLALPSRYESCPLVMVEAMLCGRPSVVNDVGGVTDWIREPDTGFVSEGVHVESFRSALVRAFTRRQEWAGIGERAHREALARIDPNPGDTVLRILVEMAGQNAPAKRDAGAGSS